MNYDRNSLRLYALTGIDLPDLCEHSYSRVKSRSGLNWQISEITYNQSFSEKIVFHEFFWRAGGVCTPGDSGVVLGCCPVDKNCDIDGWLSRLQYQILQDLFQK